MPQIGSKGPVPKYGQIHNNQFALLDDKKDGDDNDDKEPITTKINMALPVLDQATGKTLKHDSSADTLSMKMCGTVHTLMN